MDGSSPGPDGGAGVDGDGQGYEQDGYDNGAAAGAGMDARFDDGGDAQADNGNDSRDYGGAAGAGYVGAGYGGQFDDLADEETTDEEDTDDEDLDHELPEFANEENRELMEQIKAAEKERDAKEDEAEEHKERVDAMKKHLENVRGELKHVQELVAARSKDLETEDHMKQIAEREIGRIRVELGKVEQQGEEVADQVAGIQAEIQRGSERLAAFKEEMRINQEELDSWAMAIRQKEEDNLALQRYTRADESKVKELTLALERLTASVSERKRELEQVTTDATAKQVELDKVAGDFRALHAERQELITRLQESIETMERRDREIERERERYGAAKADLHARQEHIRRQTHLLEQHKLENKEMEATVEQTARVVSRTREVLRREKEALDKQQDDADLVQSELAKAAVELSQLRRANGNHAAAMEDAQRKLEAARQRAERARKKKEKAVASAEQLEERAASHEHRLKDQERALQVAERDLAKLKEQLFKESEGLAALRRQEGELAAGISGSRSAGRNLATKIRELDTEAARQAELVYNAEFQIQAMERKLARVKGDVSDEERKRLEAKVAEIQAELDRAAETEGNLRAQLKKLEDDSRRAKRRQEQLTAEVAEVQSATAELVLQNKAGEQALTGAVKKRQEAQVAHDMVKLDVKRLREALSDKTDQVFGLENRQAQLRISMQERRREIEMHAKLQRAQAKLAEEERHRVQMDLRDREAKVATLKRKYQTLCARIRGATGDADGKEGESQSQAMLVIKAAQEKEELQREGDELDAAVQQAEREVRALMSTLQQTKGRNSVYRQSLRKPAAGAKPDRETLAATKQLATRRQEAQDEAFRRKRDLERAEKRIEDAASRAAELRRRTTGLQDHIGQLEQAAEQVQEEREAQRQQLEEVSAQLEAARERLRAEHGAGPDGRAAAEVQVEAAAIEANSHSVLYTLGQLAREFPQMAPTLRQLLDERNLSIPLRPRPQA